MASAAMAETRSQASANPIRQLLERDIDLARHDHQHLVLLRRLDITDDRSQLVHHPDRDVLNGIAERAHQFVSRRFDLVDPGELP